MWHQGPWRRRVTSARHNHPSQEHDARSISPQSRRYCKETQGVCTDAREREDSLLTGRQGCEKRKHPRQISTGLRCTTTTTYTRSSRSHLYNKVRNRIIESRVREMKSANKSRAQKRPRVTKARTKGAQRGAKRVQKEAPTPPIRSRFWCYCWCC